MAHTLEDVFGPVISSYTRKQAIEDGVLVDLRQDAMASVCMQHYKYPIACTASVFSIMEAAVNNKRHCQDYAGILHDMLYMSRVMKRKLSPDTVLFRVKIVGAGRQSLYEFKMVCGPGDDAEPVLTIMLPTED